MTYWTWIVCFLCLSTSNEATFRYVNTTMHSFMWPNQSTFRAYKKNTVQVSVILPDNSTFQPYIKKTGAGILQGFLEAQTRGLTKGLNFNLTFRDSGCNSTFGPGSFNNAIFEGVDVVFGPSCEYSLGKLMFPYSKNIVSTIESLLRMCSD